MPISTREGANLVTRLKSVEILEHNAAQAIRTAEEIRRSVGRRLNAIRVELGIEAFKEWVEKSSISFEEAEKLIKAAS